MKLLLRTCSIFLLLFMISELFAQSDYDFSESEMQKFFMIYMESKKFSTHISGAELKSVQTKLDLTDEQLEVVFKVDRASFNSQEKLRYDKLRKELVKITQQKKEYKQNQIQKLCRESELPSQKYEAILKLYNTNTEFQNMVCQTVN